MKKVIILFLLIHVGVFGQKIIHYTTENGLPHDMVYNSHQDSKGYLWIGTDNGLVRFNGKKFKIYNEKNGLTNNYVIDIKTYNKDTLVLATWGGGLHFLIKDTILKAKGTKPSKINELVANTNNIYSYIAGSTIRYVKRSKEFKPISIAINASKKIIERETIRNRPLFSPRVTIIKDEVYLHNRFLKRAKIGKLKGIFIIKENKVLQVFPFLKNTPITTFTSNKGNYFASTKDTLIHFNKERILFKEKLSIRKLTILKIVPWNRSCLKYFKISCCR